MKRFIAGLLMSGLMIPQLNVEKANEKLRAEKAIIKK